jgi:NAD(P)-dependent dehydrogenase (short-subunit alcohol dehydrogenase family)
VRTTPAGRFGQPDEVAWWICQLLSPESAWVTGSLFTLDGGRSS